MSVRPLSHCYGIKSVCLCECVLTSWTTTTDLVQLSFLFWLLFHLSALKCSYLLTSCTTQPQTGNKYQETLCHIYQTFYKHMQWWNTHFVVVIVTSILFLVMIIIIILMIIRLEFVCVCACAHLSCLTPTCLPTTFCHCSACHLSANHLLLLLLAQEEEPMLCHSQSPILSILIFCLPVCMTVVHFYYNKNNNNNNP